MNHGTIAQRTAHTGLMAGLTLFGVFLSGHLPLIGGLVLAAAGVPALLVILGWGVAWFGLYGLMTLALATAWQGLPSAVLLVPTLLAPVGLLAWAVQSGFDAFRSIAVTLVVSCLFSLAFWFVAPILGDLGIALWQSRDGLIRQGRVVEAKLTELAKDKDGGRDTGLLILRDQFREWIDYVSLLIPFTFLFLWHLTSIGILYAGGNWLGGRFGFGLPQLSPFATWRFDWNLIWLFIAGWVLFYGEDLIGAPGFGDMGRMIGANCLAISKVLYFIIGLSLLFSFFDSWKLSGPNRLGLSFLALFFNQILVWLGIVDVWLDFRAPKEPAAKTTDSDEGGSFFD